MNCSVTCICGDCADCRSKRIFEAQAEVHNELQDITCCQIMTDVFNGELDQAQDYIAKLDDAHYMKLRASLDRTIQMLDRDPQEAA